MIRLSQLHEADAVNPILDLLNIGWEKQVMLALKEMGLGSLEEVVKKMGWKPNPNFKRDAVIRRHGESNVTKLIQNFKHGDRFERVSAMLQMAWIDAPETTEVLLNAVTNKDPYIRFVSVDVLHMKINYGFIPNHSLIIFDHLLARLADENPHVKRNAIRTLGSLVHYRKKKGTKNSSFQTLPDDAMKRLRNHITSSLETEDNDLIKVEVDTLNRILK